MPKMLPILHSSFAAETFEEQNPLPNTDWKVRIVRHGYGHDELQLYYVILWGENDKAMAREIGYSLPNDEYTSRESAKDHRSFHREMLFSQFIDAFKSKALRYKQAKDANGGRDA